MLEVVNSPSLDKLMHEVIPSAIHLKNDLDLPTAKSEFDFIDEFRSLAEKNTINKSLIGMGYYGNITPPVIQRNILENPGWYTAYTPYQAEIAQGRLEALINFQTMVIDLTGMEIANASLLDEGTAAAEAMIMAYNARKGQKKKSTNFFVDALVFPQTLDVLKTRSEPFGIEITVGNASDLNDFEDYFGLLVQYPADDGSVHDYTEVLGAAKHEGVVNIVAADLMSLVLLRAPGEFGADVVVGTTQRFGIPMGFGGPHAAYFATREAFKRQIPGRIIGVSTNAEGYNAYRMALQTREQHIRREKATSNICTAQVLLAVMAGMYGVYHGPDGLRRIAGNINALARLLSKNLSSNGVKVQNEYFFDTLKIEVEDAEKVSLDFRAEGYNIRIYDSNHIGISVDETTDLEDISVIAKVLAGQQAKMSDEQTPASIPDNLLRKSSFLEHPIFNKYHSEHEMLRYIKRLENKDLSLVHSMISLGSCTMKLNATSEMIPVSWPEFSNIHPFTPQEQTIGYKEMIDELSGWLCEITGFDAMSMQPNSGAQGEYAGLMVIREYHHSRGDFHRNVALIPSSAHGTNPASAVMAGMNVVIVKCDDRGNIDVSDLREKASAHAESLAALMVTYPSTHGVFEEQIVEICEIIHQFGGQVYMDGANMNAQVGLTSPAAIGADVCHLNLHKTFCIPHGGGGPGMGPIGVRAHLEPFLPGSPIVKTGGEKAISAISAAPYGSASILTISYAYIAMMGVMGLKKATQVAILNANYIKERLSGHFDVLYTGKNGRCAHEMILDMRGFKNHNIEVEDIAKRLMDYGFHAPTMSFPVPGTMMIEPTESETLEELDRFCDAFISIREEIAEVENGKVDANNNVLKNAPHTMQMISSDNWDRPYSRQKAAFPLEFVAENKFWPASSRIDNAYGDRNLICSCLPVDSYEEELVETED